MGFLKLLIGWAVSLAVYASIVAASNSSGGRTNSGFAEAMLGISVLIAIPGFLFALVIGWPIMTGLRTMVSPWLLPVAAGLAFAFVMWVLTNVALPDGWRGAGQGLIGYATVLGFVWGSLNQVFVIASHR